MIFEIMVGIEGKPEAVHACGDALHADGQVGGVHATLGGKHLLVVFVAGTLVIEEHLVLVRAFDRHVCRPVAVVGAEGEVGLLMIDGKLDEAVRVVGEEIEAREELIVTLEDELAATVVVGGVYHIAILRHIVTHKDGAILAAVHLQGDFVTGFGHSQKRD